MNTPSIREYSSRIDDIQQRQAEEKLRTQMDEIFWHVKSRARMIAFAVPIALAGAGHADQVVAVDTESGTSTDAQGGVIDSPLNEEHLNSQITITKNKIAEIEAKEILVGVDRKNIYLLKKELIALENQKQAVENGIQAKQAEVINAEKSETANNKEAIKAKTEAIENLKKITTILGG